MAFSDNGWLGGISCYRNLFSAIKALPERRIDPVLITSGRGVDALKKPVPRHGRHLLAAAGCFLAGQSHAAGDAGGVAGRDFLMERALRSTGIGFCRIPGTSANMRRFAASPGFRISGTYVSLRFRRESSPRAPESGQHLSSRVHTVARQRIRIVRLEKSPRRRRCDGGCCSSLQTFRHRKNFAARSTRGCIWQWCGIATICPTSSGFTKNHAIVLAALALLRRRPGQPVIATGNTDDPRQPHHFSSLMETARGLGVDDLFRPLGVVPYIDTMSLMRHAVGVINPSKFEGWSTTVEEAKSMGKRYSALGYSGASGADPDRAGFSATGDAARLAELMSRCAPDSVDAVAEAVHVDRAATALPARRQAFCAMLRGHRAGNPGPAWFRRQTYIDARTAGVSWTSNTSHAHLRGRIRPSIWRAIWKTPSSRSLPTCGRATSISSSMADRPMAVLIPFVVMSTTSPPDQRAGCRICGRNRQGICARNRRHPVLDQRRGFLSVRSA